MIKKIGLLFSLSGTVSVVGEGQLHAALLAIDEINRSSALTFEPLIRDDRSDPREGARQAYSLFTEGKVDVLVGCYMSSVRNSVISALNETGGLLIYPTLYEGEQVHPNVFYLGAVPNQQVEPLLWWTFQNVSGNFVLVGSDYVYPRSTNRQVKRWVENGGGKVLLESYFALGCTSFTKFFRTLKRLIKPYSSAVVFSTLVGSSVPAFYREFRQNKFSFPIVSPLTSERELSMMDTEVSRGHVCASPYFQSLETQSNKRFVDSFRHRFGEQPINREMMTTYGAIRLLSTAYEPAGALPYGRTEAEKVRTVLKDLRFQGPQGRVIIDPSTQHLWQWSHIGRVNSKGIIDVIWSSPGPIPPRHENPGHGTTRRTMDDELIEDGADSLVGTDRKFVQCVETAKIAGQTDSTVLITGETGTGKDLLASYIHRISARKDKPFVAINCASIPRELVESELFGYVDGAFTGARKNGNPGKFELGNGGTVFLDEIGEMPKDLQAHLLRVIEDKQIYRIGGTKAIRLDLRFIAATNMDLARETTDGGSFRRDLFYRLSVFHIHLPPLCERTEDIAALADHFLQICNNLGAIKKVFSPGALKQLDEYEWPGNVRELANVVERSFHLSRDSNQIDRHHVSEQVGFLAPAAATVDRNPKTSAKSQRNAGQGMLDDSRYTNGSVLMPRTDLLRLTHNQVPKLKEVEEELIRHALSSNWFNLSKTARALGIGRSTLYRKLKKFGAAPRE
jgi:DNA-binding NtrC family response regulator/ABC-type branched-subunit amino acid transport system substrate-binding protein